MRALRAPLLALAMVVVGVGLITAGSLGADPRHALPAPITITTGRASYVIAPDGHVRRIANPPSPVPSGADLQPLSGVWYETQHGHLAIGRGQAAIWRSHGRIEPNQVGVIMASARTVAFQHDHMLYLAALGGGIEHAVASREMPLGFTGGGLYTYRYATQQLLLRGDTGRPLKVIARQPCGSDYQVVDGTLYFIVHGTVMSARGAQVRALASLATLGLSTNTWLQPLGRLIELEDDTRLVLLRPDGALFARTPLQRNRDPSSPVVLSPDASAVAYTASGGGATEITYTLRAGADTATPVHRDRIELECEQGVSLQWHGSWLLYSASGGYLAAIDTAGADRATQLSRVVRRLLGEQPEVSAYWGEHPPPGWS